jgi:hypothetical protein
MLAMGCVGMELTGARANEVPVRHPQGSAHGFVEVVTLEGQRIGVGDLRQRLKGTLVTSRLTLNFFDGSLDDETTVFSERGMIRFVSDHHVQRGPSFPTPTDVSIEAASGTVSTRHPDGRTETTHLDMPADVYNGLASTLLMNIEPSVPETRIAIVVPLSTPRIAHLSMKNGGEVKFTVGGRSRVATDFVVHVELGGVPGIVAPLIGKEPRDFHVLILTGADPAFIREEGQLYAGGPVWRIQQISAVMPQ